MGLGIIKSSTTSKYTPYIVGGVAILTAITFVLVLKKVGLIGKSDEEKKGEDEIKSLGINTKNLTISESTAKAIANTVFKGIDGVGTSTRQIIDAFGMDATLYLAYWTWDIKKSKLNKDDLLLIKKQYGVRNGMTMAQALLDEVDKVPYKALSELYSDRGISL